MRIDVRRDRKGRFMPQLIGKHERRFTGFNDKIVAMYARDMTLREIQRCLAEIYSVDVSPDLISRVTDEVMSINDANHGAGPMGNTRSDTST